MFMWARDTDTSSLKLLLSNLLKGGIYCLMKVELKPEIPGTSDIE